MATNNTDADRLRRRSVYIERAIKALQDHNWHMQRDPVFAELLLCDALRFVLDVDFSDQMAMCRDELRIDGEGFPIGDDGYPVDDGERDWIPLEKVA